MPLAVFNKRRAGIRKVIETLFYEDMKKGGVNVIVAPVFVEDEFFPEMALKAGLQQIIVMKDDVLESLDKLSICLTYDEILKAVKEDKIAVILAFEGVEPIQTDIDLLKVFYQMGVRMCGLSWSRRNFAADGCGFEKEEKR